MQQLYQTGALCRPSVRRSLGRSVTKSNPPVAQYKSHVTKRQNRVTKLMRGMIKPLRNRVTKLKYRFETK